MFVLNLALNLTPNLNHILVLNIFERDNQQKIKIITHAKGKNGGHVLPLSKLRDLSKDPLRVPQVFPINVKGNTLPFFFRNLLVHPHIRVSLQVSEC